MPPRLRLVAERRAGHDALHGGRDGKGYGGGTDFRRDHWTRHSHDLGSSCLSRVRATVGTHRANPLKPRLRRSPGHVRRPARRPLRWVMLKAAAMTSTVVRIRTRRLRGLVGHAATPKRPCGRSSRAIAGVTSLAAAEGRAPAPQLPCRVPDPRTPWPGVHSSPALPVHGLLVGLR